MDNEGRDQQEQQISGQQASENENIQISTNQGAATGSEIGRVTTDNQTEILTGQHGTQDAAMKKENEDLNPKQNGEKHCESSEMVDLTYETLIKELQLDNLEVPPEITEKNYQNLWKLRRTCLYLDEIALRENCDVKFWSDVDFCSKDKLPPILTKVIEQVKELVQDKERLQFDIEQNAIRYDYQSDLITGILIYILKQSLYRYRQQDGEKKVWEPLLDKETVRAFLQLTEILAASQTPSFHKDMFANLCPLFESVSQFEDLELSRLCISSIRKEIVRERSDRPRRNQVNEIRQGTLPIAKCPYMLFPEQSMPIKALMESELPYSEKFVYTSKISDLKLEVCHADLIKPENVDLTSREFIMKQNENYKSESEEELMQLADIIVCMKNVVDCESRDQAILMWLLSMQQNYNQKIFAESTPKFSFQKFIEELQFILKNTKNSKVAQSVLETIEEFYILLEGQSFLANLKSLGYDQNWNQDGSGILSEETINKIQNSLPFQLATALNQIKVQSVQELQNNQLEISSFDQQMTEENKNTDKNQIDLTSISVKLEPIKVDCVRMEVFQNPKFQTSVTVFFVKMFQNIATSLTSMDSQIKKWFRKYTQLFSQQFTTFFASQCSSQALTLRSGQKIQICVRNQQQENHMKYMLYQFRIAGVQYQETMIKQVEQNIEKMLDSLIQNEEFVFIASEGYQNQSQLMTCDDKRLLLEHNLIILRRVLKENERVQNLIRIPEWQFPEKVIRQKFLLSKTNRPFLDDLSKFFINIMINLFKSDFSQIGNFLKINKQDEQNSDIQSEADNEALIPLILKMLKRKPSNVKNRYCQAVDFFSILSVSQAGNEVVLKEAPNILEAIYQDEKISDLHFNGDCRFLSYGQLERGSLQQLCQNVPQMVQTFTKHFKMTTNLMVGYCRNMIKALHQNERQTKEDCLKRNHQNLYQIVQLKSRGIYMTEHLEQLHYLSELLDTLLSNLDASDNKNAEMSKILNELLGLNEAETRNQIYEIQRSLNKIDQLGVIKPKLKFLIEIAIFDPIIHETDQERLNTFYDDMTQKSDDLAEYFKNKEFQEYLLQNEISSSKPEDFIQKYFVELTGQPHLDKVQTLNWLVDSLQILGNNYILLVSLYGRHITLPEAAQSIHKISLDLALFGESERQKILVHLYTNRNKGGLSQDYYSKQHQLKAEKWLKSMSSPFKSNISSFEDLVNDVFEFQEATRQILKDQQQAYFYKKGINLQIFSQFQKLQQNLLDHPQRIKTALTQSKSVMEIIRANYVALGEGLASLVEKIDLSFSDHIVDKLDERFLTKLMENFAILTCVSRFYGSLSNVVLVKFVSKGALIKIGTYYKVLRLLQDPILNLVRACDAESDSQTDQDKRLLIRLIVQQVHDSILASGNILKTCILLTASQSQRAQRQLGEVRQIDEACIDLVQDTGSVAITSMPHFYANMYSQLLVLLSGINLAEVVKYDAEKDYTKDAEVRALISDKLSLQFAKAFEEDAKLDYLGENGEKSLLITLLNQFAAFFPECQALRNPRGADPNRPNLNSRGVGVGVGGLGAGGLGVPAGGVPAGFLGQQHHHHHMFGRPDPFAQMAPIGDEPMRQPTDDELNQMIGMGFEPSLAAAAIQMSNFDCSAALELLLGGNEGRIIEFQASQREKVRKAEELKAERELDLAMKMSVEASGAEEDEEKKEENGLIPKISTVSEDDFKWHVAATVESSIQAFLNSVQESKELYSGQTMLRVIQKAMGGRPPKNQNNFDYAPPQIKAPNELVKFGQAFQEQLRQKVLNSITNLAEVCKETIPEQKIDGQNQTEEYDKKKIDHLQKVGQGIHFQLSLYLQMMLTNGDIAEEEKFAEKLIQKFGSSFKSILKVIDFLKKCHSWKAKDLCNSKTQFQMTIESIVVNYLDMIVFMTQICHLLIVNLERHTHKKVSDIISVKTCLEESEIGVVKLIIQSCQNHIVHSDLIQGLLDFAKFQIEIRSKQKLDNEKIFEESAYSVMLLATQILSSITWKFPDMLLQKLQQDSSDKEIDSKLLDEIKKIQSENQELQQDLIFKFLENSLDIKIDKKVPIYQQLLSLALYDFQQTETQMKSLCQNLLIYKVLHSQYKKDPEKSQQLNIQKMLSDLKTLTDQDDKSMNSKSLEQESQIEAKLQIELLTENLKQNPYCAQIIPNISQSLLESFSFEEIQNKTQIYLKSKILKDQIEKQLKAEKGIRQSFFTVEIAQKSIKETLQNHEKEKNDKEKTSKGLRNSFEIVKSLSNKNIVCSILLNKDFSLEDTENVKAQVNFMNSLQRKQMQILRQVAKVTNLYPDETLAPTPEILQFIFHELSMQMYWTVKQSEGKDGSKMQIIFDPLPQSTGELSLYLNRMTNINRFMSLEQRKARMSLRIGILEHALQVTEQARQDLSKQGLTTLDMLRVRTLLLGSLNSLHCLISQKSWFSLMTTNMFDLEDQFSLCANYLLLRRSSAPENSPNIALVSLLADIVCLCDLQDLKKEHNQNYEQCPSVFQPNNALKILDGHIRRLVFDILQDLFNFISKNKAAKKSKESQPASNKTKEEVAVKENEQNPTSATALVALEPVAANQLPALNDSEAVELSQAATNNQLPDLQPQTQVQVQAQPQAQPQAQSTINQQQSSDLASNQSNENQDSPSNNNDDAGGNQSWEDVQQQPSAEDESSSSNNDHHHQGGNAAAADIDMALHNDVAPPDNDMDDDSEDDDDMDGDDGQVSVASYAGGVVGGANQEDWDDDDDEPNEEQEEMEMDQDDDDEMDNYYDEEQDFEGSEEEQDEEMDQSFELSLNNQGHVQRLVDPRAIISDFDFQNRGGRQRLAVHHHYGVGGRSAGRQANSNTHYQNDILGLAASHEGVVAGGRQHNPIYQNEHEMIIDIGEQRMMPAEIRSVFMNSNGSIGVREQPERFRNGNGSLGQNQNSTVNESSSSQDEMQMCGWVREEAEVQTVLQLLRHTQNDASQEQQLAVYFMADQEQLKTYMKIFKGISVQEFIDEQEKTAKTLESLHATLRQKDRLVSKNQNLYKPLMHPISAQQSSDSPENQNRRDILSTLNRGLNELGDIANGINGNLDESLFERINNMMQQASRFNQPNFFAESNPRNPVVQRQDPRELENPFGLAVGTHRFVQQVASHTVHAPSDTQIIQQIMQLQRERNQVSQEQDPSQQTGTQQTLPILPSAAIPTPISQRQPVAQNSVSNAAQQPRPPQLLNPSVLQSMSFDNFVLGGQPIGATNLDDQEQQQEVVSSISHVSHSNNLNSEQSAVTIQQPQLTISNNDEAASQEAQQEVSAFDDSQQQPAQIIAAPEEQKDQQSLSSEQQQITVLQPSSTVEESKDEQSGANNSSPNRGGGSQDQVMHSANDEEVVPDNKDNNQPSSVQQSQIEQSEEKKEKDKEESKQETVAVAENNQTTPAIVEVQEQNNQEVQVQKEEPTTYGYPNSLLIANEIDPEILGMLPEDMRAELLSGLDSQMAERQAQQDNNTIAQQPSASSPETQINPVASLPNEQVEPSSLVEPLTNLAQEIVAQPSTVQEGGPDSSVSIQAQEANQQPSAEPQNQPAASSSDQNQQAQDQQQPAVSENQPPANNNDNGLGIDQTFLDSLPDNVRQELMQSQELMNRNLGVQAQQQLQAQNEQAAGNNNSQAQAAAANEVDIASTIAMVADASLRREMLLNLTPDQIRTLPQNLRSEYNDAQQDMAHQHDRILREEMRRQNAQRHGMQHSMVPPGMRGDPHAYQRPGAPHSQANNLSEIVQTVNTVSMNASKPPFLVQQARSLSTILCGQDNSLLETLARLLLGYSNYDKNADDMNILKPEKGEAQNNIVKTHLKKAMSSDLLPVLVSLCDLKPSKSANSGSTQRPNRDKLVNLACQILADETRGNSELRSIILQDESLVEDLDALGEDQSMQVDMSSEIQMIDTTQDAQKTKIEKQKKEKSESRRVSQLKTSLVLIGLLRIMCSQGGSSFGEYLLRGILTPQFSDQSSKLLLQVHQKFNKDKNREIQKAPLTEIIEISKLLKDQKSSLMERLDKLPKDDDSSETRKKLYKDINHISALQRNLNQLIVEVFAEFEEVLSKIQGENSKKSQEDPSAVKKDPANELVISKTVMNALSLCLKLPEVDKYQVQSLANALISLAENKVERSDIKLSDNWQVINVELQDFAKESVSKINRRLSIANVLTKNLKQSKSVQSDSLDVVMEEQEEEKKEEGDEIGSLRLNELQLRHSISQNSNEELPESGALTLVRNISQSEDVASINASPSKSTHKSSKKLNLEDLDQIQKVLIESKDQLSMLRNVITMYNQFYQKQLDEQGLIKEGKNEQLWSEIKEFYDSKLQSQHLKLMNDLLSELREVADGDNWQSKKAFYASLLGNIVCIFESFEPEVRLTANIAKQAKKEKNAESQASQEKKNDEIRMRPISSLELEKQQSGKVQQFFRNTDSVSDRLTQLSVFCLNNKKTLNKLFSNYKNLFKSYDFKLRNYVKFMPNLLDFENKRSFFRSEMERLRHGHRGRITLRINRNNIFQQAYQELNFRSVNELRGKLFIKYDGEAGQDAGGLTRDFYIALSRAMFNPDYSLFNLTDNGVSYYANPQSYVNTEHLNFFKFIGRMVGKAIYDGMLLECYFARSLYKMMLGEDIVFEDLRDLDNDFYRNMEWTLNNEVSGLCFYFMETKEYFGKKTEVELIPGGTNIEVTNENKREYVEKKVFYKMYSSVKDQIDAFLSGFHDMIPKELISIFNHKELELLISGLPTFDLVDLKANTELRGYTMESVQIVWLFEILEAFDKQEKALFLQFVTGSSKIPLDGFKALQGMQGIDLFKVVKIRTQDPQALPYSHTCFNQIDLPEYPSKDLMQERLLFAIKETSGFGMA